MKIYLPLAIHGWKGYEGVIDHHVEMGVKLKGILQGKGWVIKNNSSLPIICFTTEKDHPQGIASIVNRINASGKAWVSSYPIDGVNTCRICITNYLTNHTELDELVTLLDESSI